MSISSWCGTNDCHLEHDPCDVCATVEDILVLLDQHVSSEVEMEARRRLIERLSETEAPVAPGASSTPKPPPPHKEKGPSA